MNTITSRKNPRVVAAARLDRAAVRHSSGLALAEGPHIVREAIDAGVKVVEVFGLELDRESEAMAERAGADWVPCSEEVLQRIASTENPRGPVGVFEIPRCENPVRNMIVLYLADPGNAGTMIRTAGAFGFDVGCAPGSVDVWSPKVIRAGAGAHFRTRVIQPVSEIPDGYGVVATVVSGGVDPRVVGGELAGIDHWAILIGNEAHGLESEVSEGADIRVTIPMPGGTESLNAGVAGSIIVYEISRHFEVGEAPIVRH